MLLNTSLHGANRVWQPAVKCIFIFLITGALTSGALGQEAASSPTEKQTDSLNSGEVRGTVFDESETQVTAAEVTFTAGSIKQTAVTDDNGNFIFHDAPEGAYTLQILKEGMGEQDRSGALKPGETVTLDPIVMRVGRLTTEVEVLPQDQVARIQIHEQEKQRLGGVIPNFYVVYDADPVPMNTRLKYQLAWKTIIDPVNILLVAANAGFEQSQGEFSGFGSGPSGFGKRFGAGMGDFVIGSVLINAVMPQVFKQDPRYFYKGTGSVWSRTGYALTRVVVCKGDNKKWQPCYSSVLGTFASSGLSNIYYPASDRHGATLTLENGAVGFAYGAFGNVVQEFVLKHLTPKKYRNGADLP